MIHVLETFLEAAVSAALPGTVQMTLGPYRPSPPGAVVIHARDLVVAPPSRREVENEPAHLMQEYDWNTDGLQTDFDIPTMVPGDVVEVQSPPGTVVEVGDDYYVDERTLRFYRPPAAASPGVRARLRGARAPGWTHQRECTLTLDISAWADEIDVADEQLNIALNVALAQLVDLPVLQAARVVDADVWLRIRSPRVWLSHMERAAHDTSALYMARATLELQAELDVVVTRGALADAGVIEALTGAIATARDGDVHAPPRFFTVTGPELSVSLARFMSITGLRPQHLWVGGITDHAGGIELVAAGDVALNNLADGLILDNGITTHAASLSADGSRLHAPNSDLGDLDQSRVFRVLVGVPKPDAQRNLLGKREGASGEHRGFEITILPTGQLYVRCQADAGGAPGAVYEDSIVITDVGDQSWHVVVFAYDVAASTFELATEAASGGTEIIPGNCAASVQLSVGSARLPGAAMEVAMVAVCSGDQTQGVDARQLAATVHAALVQAD